MPKAQRKSRFNRAYKYGKAAYNLYKKVQPIVKRLRTARKVLSTVRTRQIRVPHPAERTIVSPNNGLSHTRCTINNVLLPAYRTLLKGKGRDTTMITTTGGNFSPIGRQRAGYFGLVGTKSQLQTAYNASRNVNLTWSSALSITATTNVNMFVIYMQCKTLITNQSVSDAILTLYDVTCKFDLGGTVVYPHDDWAAIMAETKGANVGALGTPECVGALPTSLQEFKKRWNIRKKSKIHLGTGKTHEHILR